MPAPTSPCRAAYSNAPGFSDSVTSTTVIEMGSEKASIGSIVLTDEMCRNKSRFYTFQIGYAKWTFSQLSLIQEHDLGPFERTRGAPIRLNFFKFLLVTLIGHTNGTDIEVM
ncbi:hypothetical protein TNCV_3871361 [Trichonephila clavipes]|nr:hypothetical protein TNCV_3871361 [Trichonephila clavipes]